MKQGTNNTSKNPDTENTRPWRHVRLKERIFKQLTLKDFIGCQQRTENLLTMSENDHMKLLGQTLVAFNQLVKHHASKAAIPAFPTSVHTAEPWMYLQDMSDLRLSLAFGSSAGAGAMIHLKAVC